MWKAFVNLTAFQKLIIIVSISVVVSQLLINTFYEWNAPEAGRKSLLDAKLSEFYQSAAYRDRKRSDSIAVSLLVADASVRISRNNNSVSAGGQLVTNVNNQTARVADINAKTQAWIDAQTEAIRKNYSQVDTGVRWGGIGLVYVFEFLSVMLGFMAARILTNERIEKKTLRNFSAIVVAGLSIYAQITSCQITEKGLLLLLNDAEMAGKYSTAFAIVVPLYFWIGSFDLETKERSAQVFVPEVTKPTAKIEQHEYTEEESLTRRKTIRGSKAEFQVPVDLISAVMLYRSGRISKENGWSQRRIAKEFAEGDLNKVHKMIAEGSSSPITLDVSRYEKNN